jgi:hypothetical protein
MSDYMKEAERLLDAFIDASNPTLMSSAAAKRTLAALLAHIQRGAGVEVGESVTCEQCGHENWIMYGKAPAQITAADKLAPAPDQFRDAAKMMAEPAEVPMPEPDSECTHTDDHLYPVWREDQIRTYGAACRAAGEAAGYARGLKEAGRDAAPLVQNGEVLVTVTGLTGSGKSAIAGEIEIMCRALGLEVEWGEGAAEKHLTHADWTNALEMYRPRVRIVEANIPRTDAALRGEVK